MRTVLFLVRKEFLQVFRDPILVFQLFAVPFIQILLITSAATFEVKDVDVYLVDRDRTPASRQLVDAFEASGRFQFTASSLSDAAANRALTNGTAGLILQIPNDFEDALTRTHQAEVQLIFDGTDGATAGTAQSYALSILRHFGHAYGADLRPVVDAPAPGLHQHHRRWYNVPQAYDDYMAPGILVILVTLVGTLMTSLNIVREKELGTIEQLNVTPITKGQFISGKLIPFWILGLVELGFGLLLAKAVFDFPVLGNVGLVFLGGAIYLVAALGIGLLVSTTTETQQQAMFVVFFILVIYLFLSGLFTPVASMPAWAQWIAEVNPIKHLITLIRAVLLKGAGIVDVARELAILTGFAVLILPLASRLYSKTAS